MNHCVVSYGTFHRFEPTVCLHKQAGVIQSQTVRCSISQCNYWTQDLVCLPSRGLSTTCYSFIRPNDMAGKTVRWVLGTAQWQRRTAAGQMSSTTSFLLYYFHSFSSLSYFSPPLFVPLVLYINVSVIYPLRTMTQLVEALRQKPEGRGFDSRWWHNPSDRTRMLGSDHLDSA